MSTPAPLDPQPPHGKSSSSEPILVLEPTFEDRLRDFWDKHARTIYAVCGAILLAILVRGAIEYYQQEKEAGIRSEYAQAGTPEKLKAFVGQHPEHSLAAAAALKLADEAYSKNNYTEAVQQYQRAVDILKEGPLAGRARLGAAVSKVALGQAAEGEQALRQLANDVAQLKTLRAEAGYHLATLAIEAGRPEDAAKALEQASSVDQMGIWAQRAMMLRATLPVSAAPTPETPAVTAPTVTP